MCRRREGGARKQEKQKKNGKERCGNRKVENGDVGSRLLLRRKVYAAPIQDSDRYFLAEGFDWLSAQLKS